MYNIDINNATPEHLTIYHDELKQDTNEVMQTINTIRTLNTTPTQLQLEHININFQSSVNGYNDYFNHTLLKPLLGTFITKILEQLTTNQLIELKDLILHIDKLHAITLDSIDNKLNETKTHNQVYNGLNIIYKLTKSINTHTIHLANYIENAIVTEQYVHYPNIDKITCTPLDYNPTSEIQVFERLTTSLAKYQPIFINEETSQYYHDNHTQQLQQRVAQTLLQHKQHLYKFLYI